jgi:hypothetical protein
VGSPGVSVSVSFGGGGVAWFPLGPREVYVPARRFSPHYVERVNVSNTVIVNRTYITNVYNNRVPDIVYRNRGVPGAVTAVSRETFVSAGRVADHRVRVTETDITRTRVTGVAPRIAPEPASRLGGTTRANFRPPPRTVVERQVIVKREPPAPSAHFARRAEVTTAPPRVQDFGAHGQQNPNEPVVRNHPDRVDRPPHADHAGRVEQPAPGATPRAQPVAPDQHAQVEPSRDDRPQRNSREQQTPADVQQRRQWQDNQAHPQREQQQQQPQQQQRQQQPQQEFQRQDHERAQHQQESQRQQDAAHQQEQHQQDQHQHNERPHPDKPADAKPKSNPRQDDTSRPQQQ